MQQYKSLPFRHILSVADLELNIWGNYKKILLLIFRKFIISFKNNKLTSKETAEKVLYYIIRMVLVGLVFNYNKRLSEYSKIFQFFA